MHCLDEEKSLKANKGKEQEKVQFKKKNFQFQTKLIEK